MFLWHFFFATIQLYARSKLMKELKNFQASSENQVPEWSHDFLLVIIVGSMHCGIMFLVPSTIVELVEGSGVAVVPYLGIIEAMNVLCVCLSLLAIYPLFRKNWARMTSVGLMWLSLIISERFIILSKRSANEFIAMAARSFIFGIL